MQTESAVTLSHALHVNTNLKDLNLSGCFNRRCGADTLSEALAANSTISVLRLDDNPFGDDGALQIAGALRLNTGLRGLSMAYCGVNEAGA